MSKKTVFIASAPPLILASGSPYRRSLLERLQQPFEVIQAEVDETVRPGETPEAAVRRLSRAKSEAVAARLDDGLVIGSDQLASLRGAALGKPGTLERARRQLAELSGQSVDFLTGLTLTHARTGQQNEALVVTRVRFRVLSDPEILRYLQQEAAFDCAGSFKCEGFGITLVESIETDDPTALIGLPLISLVALLKEQGLPLP